VLSLPYEGVNLAGNSHSILLHSHVQALSFEIIERNFRLILIYRFGHGTFWPTNQEIDYFVSKGMCQFRIPYLFFFPLLPFPHFFSSSFKWERLQPSTGGSFNSGYWNSLKNTIYYIANTKGKTAILDPHNYARHNGAVVSQSAIKDLWKRLANEFGGNGNVVFGIMNEPHRCQFSTRSHLIIICSMETETWKDLAQAAINEIRNTGANNLILVPGNAWTGAHSWNQNWYGTPNANVMGSITDPGNNFAYEVKILFLVISSYILFSFINISIVITVELLLLVLTQMVALNFKISLSGLDNVVLKDFSVSLLEVRNAIILPFLI